jgi:hypothetical protein
LSQITVRARARIARIAAVNADVSPRSSPSLTMTTAVRASTVSSRYRFTKSRKLSPIRVPPDQSGTSAAIRASVEATRFGAMEGVRRWSDVLNAKISVRCAAFFTASRNERRNRVCGSIEPLVSTSTTSLGSSIARVRRARRRNSPSVATALRKLRRGSNLPLPRVGTSRRLRFVARRTARRSSRRSIARSSASVHCSNGRRRSSASAL